MFRAVGGASSHCRRPIEAAGQVGTAERRRRAVRVERTLCGAGPHGRTPSPAPLPQGSYRSRSPSETCSAPGARRRLSGPSPDDTRRHIGQRRFAPRPASKRSPGQMLETRHRSPGHKGKTHASRRQPVRPEFPRKYWLMPRTTGPTCGVFPGKRRKSRAFDRPTMPGATEGSRLGKRDDGLRRCATAHAKPARYLLFRIHGGVRESSKPSILGQDWSGAGPGFSGGSGRAIRA